MPKLILILILILNVTKVYANTEAHINNSIDVTDNIQIKYKWYKEELTDGLYYPKKDNLEGYIEDETKVILSDYYTTWDGKYCSYSKENYHIEYDKIYVYEHVNNSRYIKLENINYEEINDIKIFSKNKELEYEIIQKENGLIVIDLKNLYEIYYLWFNIDTEKEYDITLASSQNFVLKSLSKHIKNEKILIPDKSWITEETIFATTYAGEYIENNDFLKLIKEGQNCRVKEKKTYRYKINKIYYDDNYYTYIENYIPDESDYIIEYIGDLPTETVEITQVVKDKEIQKEYIYLNDNQNTSNNILEESSEENLQQEAIKQQTATISPIVETKYIENEVIKKIYKIPKKIYLIIGLLLMIIIIQLIKMKKKVGKKI